MEIEVYQQANRLKNSHWWFLGRKKIISTLLKRYLADKNCQILDVGCGAGTSFPVLSDFGQIFGVDKSEEAIKFCRNAGYFVLKKGEANSLPFTDEKFDLVASLDLLEHIKDDRGALSELFRVCRKGGWLVVTVPAFPFLWGENDLATHHLRRYRKDELMKKIEEAGFKIKKLSYFNFYLFPIFLIWHIFGKMKVNNQPKSSLNFDFPLVLNKIFLFLFSSEAKVLLISDFPFGLSLICLAQKI